jgi:hypothetical protein
MEVALRRLEGVDKVAISIERKQFVVVYKPGASFRPKDLRAAVKQSDVDVKQFHIQAKGQLQTEGGKQFFVAGKDRFLVSSAPQKIPVGTPIEIGADVNDTTSLIEIKILGFKPLDQK